MKRRKDEETKKRREKGPRDEGTRDEQKGRGDAGRKAKTTKR